MQEKTALSSFWKSTILTFAILMNITLCYSMFLGDRSLFVWSDLHERYITLTEELAFVNEEKALLSQQIRLLQTDKDYVETVIRQRLNYVRDNEILYIFGDTQKEDSPWFDSE